jgi:3-oxoacyl-[acyl-carrier-protein] synthase-3
MTLELLEQPSIIISEFSEVIGQQAVDTALIASPLGKSFSETDNANIRWVSEALALVWRDFIKNIEQTPIIKKIESKTVSLSEYASFLLNLRQQVIEGSCWLARAGSHMDIEHFELRAALMKHAGTEHRDYQMLEDNYCAIGGMRENILFGSKNVGSEALSAYLYQVSSQKNPIGLLGALFIFEGLGHGKAGYWANCLKETLNLDNSQVSFLAYHGENDEDHYEGLKKVLSLPFLTKQDYQDIVKVAKVSGFLYVQQLNQINNFSSSVL